MKKFKNVLLVKNKHTNEMNIVAYFKSFGDALNCLTHFRDNLKSDGLEYLVQTI